MLGALAGGGLFLTIMLVLAATAVTTGLIVEDQAGRWLLGPWLVLEIGGGAVTSILAGAVSRRIARRYLGAVVLALAVFCVALLEATELLRHAAAGRVDAPTWLVLLAPVVTAAGVLVGGWRPGTRWDHFWEGARTAWLSEALRYALPALVLVAAAVVALFVLPGLAAGAESLVVASAITVDLAVVVPGLVFVLLVRARRAPWVVIIPTFVVGYAVAAVTIPRQQHGLLEVVRLLVIPAELAVVIYVAVLTRRAWARGPGGTGDFVTRFRSAAREVLATRIPADILTTEISILYYAFRWRRSSSQSPGSYTVHGEVGYLGVVIALTVVLIVETVAVHLLLSRWSSLAAWLLTGLSIYACVWLTGDYRAMAARPIRVTATHLLMRVGVRWEAEIPLASIEQVDLLGPHDRPPKSGALVSALLGQPNLRLRLNGPVEVIGMYGIRHTVQEVWLTVDGAAELCKALRG